MDLEKYNHICKYFVSHRYNDFDNPIPANKFLDVVTKYFQVCEEELADLMNCLEHHKLKVAAILQCDVDSYRLLKRAYTISAFRQQLPTLLTRDAFNYFIESPYVNYNEIKDFAQYLLSFKDDEELKDNMP